MGRNNRHQPVISRQSDESFQEDHWLKRFEKSLLKDAVQPQRQQSLFDQINNVMNGKSKYPSVDAAVQDMQERSGLTAYLDSLNKTSETGLPTPKKVASDNTTPLVIQKHPAIMKTIENYVRDTKGNLPVPAIIDKIHAIHQTDVPDAKDWDDNKLIMLVSKLNLSAKSTNPGSYENYSNLGSRDTGSDSEIDPSNTDAFYALNPVKQ